MGERNGKRDVKIMFFFFVVKQDQSGKGSSSQKKIYVPQIGGRQRPM